MTETDLPAVDTLAAAIHSAYPEDAAVFAERLRLYPQGCYVFEHHVKIAAYVLSHPWHDGAPPALNALLGGLPAKPSTYYIHDIALLPQVRGLGAAVEIVARLAVQARAESLPSLSLIAVNGSAGFWERQGFAPVTDRTLAVKLQSYGADAQFMVRAL